MVNVAILGILGRMGQEILNIVSRDSDLNFSLGIDKGDTLDKDKFDVLIDFSFKDATLEYLPKLVEIGKPVVIGTTGFSEKEKEFIIDSSKKIPIVFSPNMGVGVNIFFKLLEDASRRLKGYDVEIVEAHHNKKKDAPSGTAMYAANLIAKSLSKTSDDFIYGREGLVGERKDEIAIHSVRGGDIVGEHSVMFIGEGERLEIKHMATSRKHFAQGAVVAAKWLTNKKPNLYNMTDVLGF